MKERHPGLHAHIGFAIFLFYTIKAMISIASESILKEIGLLQFEI